MSSIIPLLAFIFAVGNPLFTKPLEKPAVSKNEKLVLTWGTLDTTIMDNQTIAIWVRASNHEKSGLEKLPYPTDHYQLWVRTPDTTFEIAGRFDGNSYDANTSIISLFMI